MASHSVYTFFSVHNCLDAEFDAPDAEADHALCRAIVAGRYGMHPEAWDNQSSLTAVMPQGFHGYEWVPEAYRRPIARSAAAIAEQRRENTEWAARHRRRPVEEPKPPRRKPGPKPRPAWHWVAPADRMPIEHTIGGHGWVQLTCDECAVSFDRTQRYAAGRRQDSVNMIRAMGHDAGWTCIVGRDRCPRCSQAAAPKPVGNGAGGDQGDKQHA